MGKYRVVLRGGSVLAHARNETVAERLLDRQVSSKVDVLTGKLKPGDRVITGTMPLEGTEVQTRAVCLMLNDGTEFVTTYAIERG